MHTLKDPSLLRQQCYLDGAWLDAEGGATVEVHNPATGGLLGSVPRMGASEAKRAIEAAKAAWPAWRKKTGKERAVILRRWHDDDLVPMAEINADPDVMRWVDDGSVLDLDGTAEAIERRRV